MSHKAAVVFSSGPIFQDNETTPLGLMKLKLKMNRVLENRIFSWRKNVEGCEQFRADYSKFIASGAVYRNLSKKREKVSVCF